MNDLKFTELARKERNRYAREWRAKNKEKVKEANERYWANRAKRSESIDLLTESSIREEAL